jgi:hypothetical protein
MDINCNVLDNSSYTVVYTYAHEAYSLFYGGFAVENTDEGEVFAEKLKSGAAQYAIALPKRLKPEQRDLLQERGEKLLEDGGKWREKIELWKLKTAAN